VLARDLLVLALGAWGALQFLPMAINEWFPGEIAAAVALLAAACWSRRQSGSPVQRGVASQTGAARRDYGVIPAEIARLTSVAVAVAVTTAIIVLGTS
jgi:hypothetical protein